MMLDLAGKKFGRLTAISRKGKNESRNYKWLCRCDCGKETTVRGSNLKNGHTKSCGCLNTERVTKHGFCETPIYHVWEGIIQRCTNSNHIGYPHYGGRGITVCLKWLNSFENFYEDIGKYWKPGLTLSREDNDGNYCSENCEWVTWKEQARNKRNNHILEFNGKIQCITAWGEETGISENVIRGRLNLGWSAEEILTTPVRKQKKRI